MTEYDTNQTQFSQDQPIFQDVVVPEMQKPPEETGETTKQSSKKKLLIAGIAGFVLLFIVLLVFIVTRRPMEQTQILEASPSPSPVISADNPLKQRVDNLQTELDAADPADQMLVFPPIDMDIFLDPIQN